MTSPSEIKPVEAQKPDTVPWPVVSRYSGGASKDGVAGRVWVRLGDGPDETEFVRVEAQEQPAGEVLADEDIRIRLAEPWCENYERERGHPARSNPYAYVFEWKWIDAKEAFLAGYRARPQAASSPTGPTSDALLKFLCDLHAHLPEAERPMSWSDFSDEQRARAEGAFASFIKAPTGPREGEPDMSRDHQFDDAMRKVGWPERMFGDTESLTRHERDIRDAAYTGFCAADETRRLCAAQPSSPAPLQEMFEVRVAGPDDVHFCVDELAAMRMANATNKSYLADRLKHPDDEVMCIATVHRRAEPENIDHETDRPQPSPTGPVERAETPLLRERLRFVLNDREWMSLQEDKAQLRERILDIIATEAVEAQEQPAGEVPKWPEAMQRSVESPFAYQGYINGWNECLSDCKRAFDRRPQAASSPTEPGQWQKIETLVKQIHEATKRGERTEDHGLIGNLRCILDHVLPSPPDMFASSPTGPREGEPIRDALAGCIECLRPYLEADAASDDYGVSKTANRRIDGLTFYERLLAAPETASARSSGDPLVEALARFIEATADPEGVDRRVDLAVELKRELLASRPAAGGGG